jgi:hypothetical protein
VESAGTALIRRIEENLKRYDTPRLVFRQITICTDYVKVMAGMTRPFGGSRQQAYPACLPAMHGLEASIHAAFEVDVSFVVIRDTNDDENIQEVFGETFRTLSTHDPTIRRNRLVIVNHVRSSAGSG